MPRHALPVLTALLVSICAVVALAQSELVIFKEGTKEYHRPGCPVIADGKGVVALARAQAEGRGYKPHADCDPSTQKPGSGAGGPAPAKPETVYLDGTKYYHRKDCKRLEASPKAARAESLEVAGKSHWPCPDCRPPVRKRTGGSEPLGRVR